VGQPWTDECLRGVGWGLRSDGEGDVATDDGSVLLCDALPEPARRRACWLGVGFPLGDHLGSSPQRLRRALQELPLERRDWIVEGAGALVGRNHQEPAAMRAICASWGPELAASCERGAADSLTWRTVNADGAAPVSLAGLPGPFDCRVESEPSPAVAGEPMRVRVQLTPRGGGATAAGRLVFGLPPALYDLRDGLGRPLRPGTDRAVVLAGTQRLPMAISTAPESGRWYYALDFGALPASRPVTVEVDGLLAPDLPVSELDFVLRVALSGDPGFVDVCPVRPFVVSGSSSVEPVVWPEGVGAGSAALVDSPVVDRGALVDSEPPVEPGAVSFLVELGGRTNASTGLLTADESWERARASGLQVAALADPGWQLDAAELEALLDSADAANEPGRFVALVAIELSDGRLLLVSDTTLLRGQLAGQGGSHDLQETEDFGARPARFQPDPVGLAQLPGTLLLDPPAGPFLLEGDSLTREAVIAALRGR
jgi:hypothetical protein